MSDMRIYLNDLEFFGFHGLYEAEKKIGNTFYVDIIIDFSTIQETVDQLDQTIDYVEVYNSVKNIMAVPTPLLETLVAKIADQILADHAIAKNVFVKINKAKLAIPEFTGTTSVSIERKRS
jgi:dihydroneopterin aldolase